MKGRIKAVFGNMVVARTDDRVIKNAIGYCVRNDGVKLLCEVIRVRGDSVDLQIFEETRGLRVGDEVEFQEEMLSAPRRKIIGTQRYIPLQFGFNGLPFKFPPGGN